MENTGIKNQNISKLPVGAVMVIGGGIAGMQASLDLAEQGFKVYLIESKSAIGGKMAQLDKTFPTNDCAMCTISPKLVDVGRHPNIEVMTDSELIDLSGEVGNFHATILRKPRYIDISKCVGCGDCEKVCPIIISDPFNEGLISRHAAHKLYPQAVPNAYAIEKRGISPCRDACPTHQRAQGYIALIREGRWEDALRVIKMDNPFPGICGRICNHRCETACNRGLVDEPINIRALKRFVTDKMYSEPRKTVDKAEIVFPDKPVAIIGAGPCGLTAAQDIIKSGFPVTVFEAMPVAGGMLRLGVPEFRLPASIIEREVADIIDLGIDLRLNQRVNNLDDLFDEGYIAVLIAVGAHEGVRLPIPGNNLPGVIINTEFLRDVRLGKYQDGQLNGLGSNVLVLGGGNVAIDVARTAVRLGCKVSMACLEGRDTMPSHPWEVEAAMEEGITIYNDRTFERIIDDGQGHVGGIECMRVNSFSFDDSGKLSVEKIPQSNHIIACDTIIFSVGQRAGLAFIPEDTGVGLTTRKSIAINPNTFAATRAGVFAAGDSVSGTAFVVEAVASGHKAAESIIRYLLGEQLEPLPKPELPVVKLDKQEIDDRIARGEIKKQPRVPMPQLSIEQRIDNFSEVEGGYDEESARLEAERCLACGICSECMSCVDACGREAIIHDMAATQVNIPIGSVILAPGYQVYHAELSEEYGLGRYPNVVTSLQYERILSSSGPYSGHVRRPSDNTRPKRIAFLQCVGSRDQSHDYCSSVCCMYAAKEAIMTIEHARAEARGSTDLGDVTCQVFFMDTRAYSKGYEEYYHRAEEKYGVIYTRCRLSDVKENPINHNLRVRYFNNEDSGQRIVEQEFNLVVLSVGMEISESVKNLGHNLGIELDDYGFCHTTLFAPLQTSRQGIFVAGPFSEPKDIPESIIEASGAASLSAIQLAAARNSLTVKREYPPERDVSGEEQRIGVFVCHCGSNIGGYLDVPEVAKFAGKLPGVVLSEDNLYTCSQDTIAHIIEQIKTHQLNRVVVASCTPVTHEALFQDALRSAGINPNLFEMANIRNQCSWVHSNDWDGATEKAKKLVEMAVSKVGYLEPLFTSEVPVNQSALVIGGGVAGMTAALALADQGFPVHIIEKTDKLGGNLNKLRFFLPEYEISSKRGARQPVHPVVHQNGISPQQYLAELMKKVDSHPKIHVHLNSRVSKTGGFKGNFTSWIIEEKSINEIKHGVTIIATGGQEYRGSEYGYSENENIVTQQEFEAILADGHSNQFPDSVVMIQCIGPAKKYCSRLCCSTALKNAIKLKELNPKSDVTIIYRDIRTYGFKERLYTEARRKGIRFIHYEFDREPEVIFGEDSSLIVKVHEPMLNRTLELKPEILVLSMPVVPPEGIEDIASLYKLTRDMDGFFQEAHVKLRPVDFTVEGIFMAGMAHYPKFLDESISQALAAASRASIILSQESIMTNARVAVVDPLKCVGCLTCVRICPYGVPRIQSDYTGVGNIIGAAYIEPAICQGCGSCAAECPARAIQIMHFKDIQTIAKLDALFGVKEIEKSFVPLESIKVRLPGD